jgi:hypothetical protein
MHFRTLNVVVTELTISLNFTEMIPTLFKLHDLNTGLIWINGGNCRIVTADMIGELFRTANLFKQLDDETEIKKGQPLQHRIHWDDCPEVPSDLSQLLHNNADDQSSDASVDN